MFTDGRVCQPGSDSGCFVIYSGQDRGGKGVENPSGANNRWVRNVTVQSNKFMYKKERIKKLNFPKLLSMNFFNLFFPHLKSMNRPNEVKSSVKKKWYGKDGKWWISMDSIISCFIFFLLCNYVSSSKIIS